MKRLTLFFLFAVILLPGFALDESEENRFAISYLKGLQMEDLVNVEVVLDDVFDVFDGLIKARKTTIATGDTQSTARAPSVTTVITAQDIEATGAGDLEEALQMVPGLHIARYIAGYHPIYTIRGMYSGFNPEVLVLINGVPLSSLASGDRSQLWGSVPVSMISRIEVIRGPGSAVYGADAFAGVINVITKMTEDINGTESGTQVGSFNTIETWVLHSSHWGGFDIAAMVDYQTTDGQNGIIDADAQTQYDKLFGTHASLAPGPVSLSRERTETRLDILRNHWRLRVGYQDLDNYGVGAGMAQALDPELRFHQERYTTELIYHNPTLTPYWDVTAQVSYFEFESAPREVSRLFPRGAFGGAYPDGFIGGPGYGEMHTRLDLFGFYAGFRNHLIRTGIGYYHGDLDKVTEIKNYGIDPATGLPLPPGSPVIDVSDTAAIWSPETDRKNWFLSLQDTWKVANNWEFTAGIRYDHYSDFGQTINPRLALVWQVRPDLTSKLMYGSAFRAPTFGEQYYMNNPVVLGNPNLEAETVDTWELAFDYRATQNLHLAMNLFSYDLTDKILYVPDSSGKTNTAHNVGRRKASGLEMEFRWKMTKRSSLLASYAFVDAQDENNNHDAGNYPRQTAYLRTDWLLIPNWYLDLQSNWVADRKRVYGDPRPQIDDYTTIDLTLRRKDIKTGHWNLALGVRNLLDADAREPSPGPDSNGIINIPDDLPLAGRNYFLELRYHF